ncbi:MAG: hypothetical protein PUP92_10880 [Rhizonema sp. PD38]|nr:hypothetical protein [Rhizonema sp. PD38]
MQNLLNSFENLSESEKWEMASEIVKRTVSFDFPALSDEDLTLSAEEFFLELDKREAHR